MTLRRPLIPEPGETVRLGERRGVSPPVVLHHRRADAAPLASLKGDSLTGFMYQK